jgi:tRNA dimethylallyltransferase
VIADRPSDAASPPVLAIVGPTGSGKSQVAVDIARIGATGPTGRWPVEIVAVDAFTVYRGMDIGTAKPSPAVLREVPHHLVDVLDPAEEVSVAWFQSVARRVIDEVRSRGAVPLLVGGSGLYFRAVVDDLRFPPTDPSVRADRESRHRGDPAAAHRQLAAVDPDAAARIDPGNLRRTIRALEVIALTGRRFSSYRAAWEEREAVYASLEVRGSDVPDPELRRRIHARAERMVQAGLVEEAAQLRERRPSRTARNAIGYAEAFALLDGGTSTEDLADTIARRTWRYARRQRSWFRRDPRVVWMPPPAIVADWT